MAASRPAGRWVIVLGDTSAPVFWSNERESLDVVCAQVRQTCPTARVVWQEVAEERDPMRSASGSSAMLSGDPDPGYISTSYVERQNLTMRMSMRRFTRLTNVFSKKVENHAAAVALYFMYYNFGRVHQTLRVTPAMEAGVSDHVWSIEEIVNLIS